jgi:hypothetical protein
MSDDTDLDSCFTTRMKQAPAGMASLTSPSGVQRDSASLQKDNHARIEVRISGTNTSGESNGLILLPHDDYGALSPSEKANLPKMVEK